MVPGDSFPAVHDYNGRSRVDRDCRWPHAVRKKMVYSNLLINIAFSLWETALVAVVVVVKQQRMSGSAFYQTSR